MEQFGQEGTFSGHQIQPHELHLHPTFDLSEKTTKINDNYYFKEGICIGLICIHLSCRPGPGSSRDPSGCGKVPLHNPQQWECPCHRRVSRAEITAQIPLHPIRKNLHPPQIKKKKMKETKGKSIQKSIFSKRNPISPRRYLWFQKCRKWEDSRDAVL